MDNDNPFLKLIVFTDKFCNFYTTKVVYDYILDFQKISNKLKDDKTNIDNLNELVNCILHFRLLIFDIYSCFIDFELSELNRITYILYTSNTLY